MEDGDSQTGPRPGSETDWQLQEGLINDGDSPWQQPPCLAELLRQTGTVLSKLITGVISFAHGLAMTVGTIFISTSRIKKLRLREVESLGLEH